MSQIYSRIIATGSALPERVVGIMVTRGSVMPVTALDKAPVILASAALYRELGSGYEGFDGHG